MRKQSGFSLIELLIVVAIILIISAIAVPNLLRARIAANEASAVSSVRTITHAQVSYSASFPVVGFADDIGKLGPPETVCETPSEDHACLIDRVLAEGHKSGYNFTITSVPDGLLHSAYAVVANPINPGITGQRHFFSDQSGVVRFDPVNEANGQDPPIQ